MRRDGPSGGVILRENRLSVVEAAMGMEAEVARISGEERIGPTAP